MVLANVSRTFGPGIFLLNTLDATVNTALQGGQVVLVDNVSITPSFNLYTLEFSNITPQGADDALLMEVSTDSGVTWQNTNYAGMVTEFSSSAVVSNLISAAYCPLTKAMSAVDSTQGFYGTAVISLLTPSAGTFQGAIHGYGGYEATTGPTLAHCISWTMWPYASINAIRFRVLTNNISTAGGTIRIYGVVNA